MAGKKGTGFSRSTTNSLGDTMWKPVEVGRRALEQRAALPGSSESTQRLSLSRFRSSRSQE